MIAAGTVSRADAELDCWLQEQLGPVRRTEQDEHDAECCRWELEKFVQATVLGGEHWHLFLFGSTRNGFGTRSSDLDITAVPQGPAGQLSGYGGALARNVLGRLAGSMDRIVERREETFKVKELITAAKYPILKLVRGSLEVDLSVDNQKPLWNTRLLRAYAALDERVVSLVLSVKLWAQKHDLVGARKGQLSSYALAQLTIHFLQRGVDPPLPTLHDAFEKDVAAFENDEMALEVAKSQGAWPARETLAALYRGFFGFYAEKFEFGKEVVSVRLGRRALLSDVPELDSSSSKPRPRMHVEDPFELARDLGHVLSDGGVQLIDEIRKEHQQLAVRWPVARHPQNILAAEGGDSRRGAEVPPEPRHVRPGDAAQQLALRRLPRTEQERILRATGFWSECLGGGGVVGVQPSRSSTAGPERPEDTLASRPKGGRTEPSGRRATGDLHPVWPAALNSPRLGRRHLRCYLRGATSVDDIARKEAVYDALNGFPGEPQSEFCWRWSEKHGASGELPPYSCSLAADDALNCSVADACGRQGGKISGMAHALGDDLCARVCEPQEAKLGSVPTESFCAPRVSDSDSSARPSPLPQPSLKCRAQRRRENRKGHPRREEARQ
jgi:hypothetical protein